MAMTIGGVSLTHLSAGTSTGLFYPGQYYLTQNALDTRFDATPPYATARDMDDRLIKFPAVSGMGRRRMEFRGRSIVATIAIVGNRAAVEALLESCLETWTALARYTITLPGGESFQGCTLLPGGCAPLRDVVGGNALAKICQMNFTQLSETN